MKTRDVMPGPPQQTPPAPPALPRVRKPAAVRHLGAVDASALLQAVLRIGEAMWRRADGVKENTYFCFDHTQHIVFRFVAGNRHPCIFYTQPIWVPWQKLVLPVMEAASAAYGFAEPIFPKAMLARLAAGRGIPSHVDGEGAIPFTHRVHVPLQTAPGAVLTVDGQRHYLAPGHAWEINNYVHHSVLNGTAAPRIHLVFEVFDGAEAVEGPSTLD